MEYDIEIHTRNSGEKIVSVGIGGRMVAMTAFEWLQLCDQVVIEINRHGQTRPTKDALDDGDSVASTGSLPAPSLSGSEVLSQPAPSPVI